MCRQTGVWGGYSTSWGIKSALAEREHFCIEARACKHKAEGDGGYGSQGHYKELGPDNESNDKGDDVIECEVAQKNRPSQLKTQGQWIIMMNPNLQLIPICATEGYKMDTVHKTEKSIRGSASDGMIKTQWIDGTLRNAGSLLGVLRLEENGMGPRSGSKPNVGRMLMNMLMGTTEWWLATWKGISQNATKKVKVTKSEAWARNTIKMSKLMQ